MASESTTNPPPSPSQLLTINRRCCFCIPYRWQKPPDHHSDQTFWSRSIHALNKLREWSEIVAGPRWKTFIRRFNRNKHSGRQSARFQYDPLGYALNFDEGALESGDSELENDYLVRNFSSRYASRKTVVVGDKTASDRGMDVVGSSFV